VLDTHGSDVSERWLNQFYAEHKAKHAFLMNDWCNSLRPQDVVLLKPGD
jgi:hypothetical protein